MDLRSPVNIVARHEIYPDLIDDFWFTESPLFARLRDNIVPFTGGTFTKSVFRFRPMVGSFYKMGATHDITKVQTLADANFDMRFAQVSIPEFQEELEVYAKGENAVFSLLDEDLENGLSTATDLWGFAIWGQGQTDDSLINGFSEMIGDGVLPNWDGFVASSYGGQSRNGTVKSTLNGNIFWGGNPDGSTGPISFTLLDQAYTSASKGNREPNLIVCNKAASSFIRAKIEPQYRYMNDVRDPYWGGSGFMFRNAYVMVDEHAPSAQYGLSDANNYGLGNYQTAAFTNPLTGTPANGFPNSTAAPNLTPGEVIFLLNTDFIAMRISDSPQYGFGFSGFMGTPDSEKVVGRIKVAGNIEGIGSRYHSIIYGIGS
jgi:hypothetical protein